MFFLTHAIGYRKCIMYMYMRVFSVHQS